MQFPPSYQSLPTQFLSASLNNTTNAYKFYWFWAILDVIDKRETKVISIDELSIRMISLAWYPLDYYKLSFGKQDSFKPLALAITKNINIENTSYSKDLHQQLEEHLNHKVLLGIKKEIKKLLNRWVAFRFIRPFFNSELQNIPDQKVNSMIKELSNENKGYAPYYFEDGKIIIDPLWYEYFSTNQNILRSFIKWHLLEFLQKHNPSVIGLSKKIEKPLIRNLIVAKKYWQSYLKENPTNCIYRNQALHPYEISLDHFVPWSYVVHDQLWNIVPTTKLTNSLKSDSLPNIDLFFNKFCDLQYDALMFHYRQNSDVLDDYYTITKCGNLSELTYNDFKEKLLLEITNNIRNAQNLGFVNQFQL